MPADVPYARRKQKKYVEQPNGYVLGMDVLEPYDFDPETLRIISNTVFKKLMMDEELIAMAEDNILREKRLGYLQAEPDLDRNRQALEELRATRSELYKPKKYNYMAPPAREESMEIISERSRS